MSNEILVNVSPAETRVALLESGLVQEVQMERNRNRGIVANIYKGKVVRVLPGMQAAFVDIGLARAGFIHVRDFCQNSTDQSEIEEPEKDIRELVREGQELVVQVTKDPISTKGARLSTQISVSARHLVLLPNTPHIGVSVRIEDEQERARLKTAVETAAEGLLPETSGLIVRTVAEGRSEEELAADLPFLVRLWAAVARRIESLPAPACVYEDLPLAMRILRDMVKPHIEKVRVDQPKAYREMLEFAETYTPEITQRLSLYQGERPLFNMNGVEEEIEKALEQIVALKSGGYLIVEQTEAMVTIDVNTGAYVGRKNLEETIFKTNLEAAAAIARQLRLRNLGGIIILDFIDMVDEEHRNQVLRALEKAVEADSAPTTITGVSELGLVEMTRKRTRESLEQIMCEPCPVCKGRGVLKTAQTVCYEIFREIQREARVYESSRFMILAAQNVVDCLLDEEADRVAEIEAEIDGSVEFRVETIYTQEQYDIVLL